MLGEKNNPCLPGALRNKKNAQDYSPVRMLPKFDLVAQPLFCLGQLLTCSYRAILLVLESEEYLHLHFDG